MTEEAKDEAERSARALSELKQTTERDMAEAKEKVKQRAETAIEVTRRAEKIISEARNKMQEELEESARIITGVSQSLEEIINATEYVTEKELENQGEPVRSTAATSEEKAEATEPIVPVRDMSASQEADGGKVYQGTLELDISPPETSVHLGRLLKHLREVAGLEVLLVGNSGDKKTQVTVFVGKPLPLVSILKEIPPVKSVIEKDNNIQVVLETSADK
jgi:hypothetical protein